MLASGGCHPARAAGILAPRGKRRKSGEKSRRKYHAHSYPSKAAPATPDGRPSHRKPVETVPAFPAAGRRRSARRPQAAQTAFLPTWGGEVRERAVRTRCEPPAPATQPVRFFTNHESRPLSPFGSPWMRKGRTTKNRRPATASLLANSHYGLFTIVRGVGAHEQGSAHRQPF